MDVLALRTLESAIFAHFLLDAVEAVVVVPAYLFGNPYVIGLIILGMIGVVWFALRTLR
jgi:hypothetical protein